MEEPLEEPTDIWTDYQVVDVVHFNALKRK
jgi:hypothetical protein